VKPSCPTLQNLQAVIPVERIAASCKLRSIDTMSSLRMNQESALESVVDSAFYFPAGSEIPTAQHEKPLPDWQALPGESVTNSSARRHVMQLNRELLTQMCSNTLHSVHSSAFSEVSAALGRHPLSDDIPSVLMHTGKQCHCAFISAYSRSAVRRSQYE